MWYFDAWAVRDGLAFASERKPEEITANSTVFLSVPDLEPVPVGRVSTALRATRGNFQEGFRDREGEEFGFDTLEQVREVIRRAYLASGLGPIAPVENAAPRNPLLQDHEELTFEPETPQESGGQYYERKLQKLEGCEKQWCNVSAIAEVKTRSAFLQKMHAGRAAREIYPYIRAFAEATLVECAHRLAPQAHLISTRELLTGWLSVLSQLRLWDDGEQFWKFVEESRLHSFLHLMTLESFYKLIPDNSSYHKLLLFSIPAPLRTKWHPGIRVLADKLLLPLVDRDYFDYNHDLPEFVPALFCSMVIVSHPFLTSGAQSALMLDRHRIMGRALQWLERELPSVVLPPAVEEELAKYAWNRLERPAEQGTPATAYS